MTTLAFIAVRIAEEVLAVSARERWGGVHNLPSGGSFISGTWFKIIAVTFFAGTIIAFVIVSLYNRFRQGKTEDREFTDGVSRRQLTESEISTLVDIAEAARLKKIGDIFLASDAFERGADILVKESFIAGKPSNETVHVEKRLAALRAKVNFRKVAVVDNNTNGSAGKFSGAKYKASFIALFPFVRKTDLINPNSSQRSKQGDSPPGLRNLLPEFKPATVTGLVGRVLFIETMVPVNVGDRIIIIISPGSADENSPVSGAIEDIGTVEQSSQPAELLKDPNARRLGIALAGLSESQMAQLAGIVKGVKTQRTEKQNVEDSGQTTKVSQPASKDVGTK